VDVCVGGVGGNGGGGGAVTELKAEVDAEGVGIVEEEEDSFGRVPVSYEWNAERCCS
jgi:hypothetical protein